MTKFLDLDAVAKDDEFVLKLNGKEHPLVVATVDTFITNMKALEAIGMNASMIEEMEVTVGIVKRAFPSIPEKDIRGLSLTQVKAISDFARTANGEVTEVEPAGEAASEGNVPAAS